jgi:hypothetical protein
VIDPIAEAPKELVNLLIESSPRRRERSHGQEPPADLVLDTENAIARASHWLAYEADEAVEGSGGDSTTVAVAARMRDLGLSPDMALEVMLEHYNPRCAPPWDSDRLREKVMSAYKSASGTWGGALAIRQFEVEGDVARERPSRAGLFYVTFAEAAATALDYMPEPLIEGLLDQETLAVIYGPSGEGKTFVVLELAFHIATGRPFLGRETSQGLVVYVAAEGGRGIYKRARALMQHHGVPDCPMAIVPCPIDLLKSQADIKALIALIREAEAEFDQPVKLLVIDTLSRALAGGDENTSTDMGAFVRNLDKIRTTIKATMMPIHHTGKDLAKGARGWSGLRAATDTEIEVVDGVIKISKQRDMEQAADIKFELNKMSIGQARGKDVTSAVIKVITGSDFLEVELDPAAQEMMDAFENVATEKAVASGRPVADWQEVIVSREEWEQEYLDARNERIARGEHLPRSGIKRNTPSVPRAGVTPRYMRKLRNTVVESGTLRLVKENQWVKAKRNTEEHSEEHSKKVQPDRRNTRNTL